MSYQLDVIGKPFTSRDTKNGTIVVAIGAKGQYKSREDVDANEVPVSAIYTQYNTMFIRNQDQPA